MTASTMKHALILLFLTLITAHAQLGVSDSQRRVGGGGGYYNPEKFKPKTVQIRAEDSNNHERTPSNEYENTHH